ncbi:MAG: type VII toxin-antitoxin system HepT family RNase toxin [Bacillota bacterium]|jgi:uncharacterized protein YutE (UPF0331/DUF86 family)
MNSINKTLVYDRLSLINDAVIKLKELSLIPLNHFINSIEAAAAESYLRRALEAIFDVGRHILSKIGEKELAAEYKSIARGLVINGVINSDIGNTLLNMAGYRNRLVHLYHQVTDEELYQILQNNLGDIRQFVSQIKQYVGKCL